MPPVRLERMGPRVRQVRRATPVRQVRTERPERPAQPARRARQVQGATPVRQVRTERPERPAQPARRARRVRRATPARRVRSARRGQSGADPTAEAFLSHFGTLTNTGAAANGAECTLGEILLSASPGVTVGGVPANGQILPINQNQAMFALLGTTYGGNGQTTFALPDLRGLAPNNMTYSICDAGVFPSRR